MQTKIFDCVEMKQRGAEKVQEEIAGMTIAEELDFWQNGTQSLQSKQQLKKLSGEDMNALPITTA